MKKLGILMMAMALVVGMSLGVMSSDDEGDFDVELNIEEYAELTVPEVVDFGDIDLSDDYGARSQYFDDSIIIKTNTPVDLDIESRGFQDEEGNDVEDLNKWVSYSNPWASNYFGAGSSGITRDRGAGKHVSRFQVRFNTDPGYGIEEPVDEDNFYKVQSGEYTDKIIVTVSSQ